MSKLSLSDKLSILIEVSKSSYLFVLVIIILLFLGIVYFTTTKKNAKRARYIYLISSVFIIIFFLTTYHGSLKEMFTYMMDNFFIAFYFPNLAIYTFSIIVTNVIFLISIFNYKISKLIKRINIVIYIIINYLLLLILGVIKNNNLNVFSQTSIYGNKEAIALIELTSLVFFTWIIFLIIYRIILIYLKKEYKPPVKRLIRIKRVKKLPENYIPKEIPKVVYGKSLSNNKNNQKNLDLLKAYDQMFTLEDYKLLLNMLKEQKEKQRLLEKTREEENKEKNKFAELEALYKSMR